MIISITLDNTIGGIATSLISYSKAIDLFNDEHIIILPKDAAIIENLEILPNVKIISFSKLLLKFHIITKFIFRPKIYKKLVNSKWIFIHNSKIIKHFLKFRNKLGLINHSGKLRNTEHGAFNIFITSAGLKRFNDEYPHSKSKNVLLCHGFTEPQNNKQSNKKFSDINLKIISGGRFVEKKGFKDLISAASLLQKDNFKCVIHLYGSGSLEESLKEQIKSLDLNNIILKGWVPSLEQPFLESDIFCIPSYEEPFGLIMGEAMMLGLPVISTKTDGAMELFGENPEINGGILVDFSSPEQLKEAIQKFKDKEYQKKMSNNAMKNIKINFSIEKLSREIYKLMLIGGVKF